MVDPTARKPSEKMKNLPGRPLYQILQRPCHEKEALSLEHHPEIQKDINGLHDYCHWVEGFGRCNSFPSVNKEE
jgi:hypothetical protein